MYTGSCDLPSTGKSSNSSSYSSAAPGLGCASLLSITAPGLSCVFAGGPADADVDEDIRKLDRRCAFGFCLCGVWRSVQIGEGDGRREAWRVEAVGVPGRRRGWSW
jgi:hypothetical protein